MYFKKFFERIFSIKTVNESNSLIKKRYKQIRLLGFKIKLNLKRSYNSGNLPIENKKILFNTLSGSYSCNPKYIAEEIIRQKLPYKLVWVVNNNILKYLDGFPKNIELVMQNSPEDYNACLSSKVWIFNFRGNNYVKNGIFKKEEQFYIQTWHGSLGIKKIGGDSTELKGKELKKFTKISKKDASQFDYLISNGSFTTNCFKQVFWNNGKILEIGHPRNDIFFKEEEFLRKIRNKVFKKLGIESNDIKVAMYAPTFRNKRDNILPYSIDLAKIQKALKNRFGGNWFFILRLHPSIIKQKYRFIEGRDNNLFVEASDYDDMQELLVSVDVAITDYSSWIYDFILTRKPGFIFATDITEYNSDRGLYYPLTNTPFSVAENNDELVTNIEEFDNEQYVKKVEKFLLEKGCIDDGHASERVVDLIKNIINGDLTTDRKFR